MKKKTLINSKEILPLIEELNSRSIKEIIYFLESEGYINVDKGVYKLVYRKKREPFCIKVYKNEEDWRCDSYKVPRALKKYYLHPIYHNKKFVIQPWANKTLKNSAKANPIPAHLIDDDEYDLHDDNIRYYNGKRVVIDFMHYKIE